MPKSKKRKNRYIPKSRPVQQSPGAPAQVIDHSAETSSAQVAAVKPVRVGDKAPAPQTPNIGTELKLIGIITVVLIAAITVLYFIFR
jgi:hypothetical protein